MNYQISNEASSDLEKIWLYTIATWSNEQADRYINQILNELDYLCLKPTSGKDFSHLRTGYLCVKINYHLIFYRINHENRKIEIIRILHEQMDIENRLLD